MTALRTVNQSAFEFSALEKQLLNNYQQKLPPSLTPYADMADDLGVSEQTVLNSLQHLHNLGVISRIGAVFKANTVGVSTLAAMAIPQTQLIRIADMISSYSEVNHNYEREHHYNLWFVLTASNQTHLDQVLNEMRQTTGYAILNLPMKQDFYINLGFKLQWH
jgi:DNA-binding Lrp family transcriptional regulator